MNKLTQDFFQAEFPGWQPKIDYETCLNNLWVQPTIPCLDSGINIDVALTYQWVLNNEHVFTEHYTAKNQELFDQKQGANWYKQPHSQGWTSIGIIGQSLKNLKQFVSSGVPVPMDTELTLHHDAGIDIVRQFELIGMPLLRLQIARLDPGGFAQPHNDEITSGPYLNHGWIPLHDFEPGLRLYPIGTIQHRKGQIFMFDDRSIIHSIVNNSTQPRYVALIKFDYQTMSSSVTDCIKEQIKKQWFD